MALNDLLAKLAELLGLKESEMQKLEKIETRLRTSKADNVDRLEDVKQQIKNLQRQILKKKEELEASKGDVKRLVTGEIGRLLNELDRLQNRDKIIGRNIDKISVAISKIAELKDAKAHGADEDIFDDLALELDDVFAELKSADIAAKQLDKVQYDAPEEQTVDIDARLSKLDAELNDDEEMSEDMSKRLKELATEDD